MKAVINYKEILEGMGVDVSRPFMVNGEECIIRDGRTIVQSEGKRIEIAEFDEVEQHWEPKLGDKYYCLNSAGICAECNHTNNRIDKYRISIGNCFKTREEAKQHKLVVVRKDD